MDTIINALTISIGKFGISRNESNFNNDLNSIMNKLKDTNINENNGNEFNENIEADRRWYVLTSNYSKLKYLNEIINFYNLPTEGLFIQSLSIFMESIDKLTIYYLKNIYWADVEDENMIKKYFNNSINLNNPVLKLNEIIKGYNILIPIIENIRMEICNFQVESSFIDMFEQPYKKNKR